MVATCHAPAIHPIVAAKAAATADHVSRGRFALNLVMGWFTPELAMFGTEPLEHDARYAFGAEWLACVDRLWSAERPFDYEGEFFSMREARSHPHPLQPRPPVLNAGSSPAGIAFCGHDDADAEARLQEILDGADWEAAENFMSFLGLNSQSFGDQIQHVRERFVTSGGGYPIVCGPESVAEQLIEMSQAGIDGVILGFLDYERELEDFAARVLPLLEAAGVRRPVPAVAPAVT